MRTWHGKIFVVGAGSMAEAFIRGVTETGAADPRHILVINRGRADRLQRLQDTYGVAAASWVDAERARLIVLAVKPADIGTAVTALKPHLQAQTLLSFLAGVSIDTIRHYSEGRVPVIRTMPNIPVAVKAGAIAMSCADDVRESDRLDVLHLLGQIGDVVEVPESLMDAATAFSGSGPGLLCYVLEALEQAACNLGFTAETARRLLLQTVVGTARTLDEWGLSPNELRLRVTSPGGTTHAGVEVMKARDLAGAVDEALRAAAARSAEMGKAYAWHDNT